MVDNKPAVLSIDIGRQNICLVLIAMDDAEYYFVKGVHRAATVEEYASFFYQYGHFENRNCGRTAAGYIKFPTSK